MDMANRKILNFEESTKQIWKVFDDNTAIWEMSDSESVRELAQILAFFDTLNISFAPCSYKIDMNALIAWADRFSVTEKIRECWRLFRTQREVLYLAICGSGFTPDDVMYDIIKQADKNTMAYIARNNPALSKDVALFLYQKMTNKPYPIR